MNNHQTTDDEKLLRLAAMAIHENAVAEYEALEDTPDLVTEQEFQKQWNAVMKKHRQRKYRSLLSNLRGELFRKIAAVIAALSVLGGGVTATVVAVNPQIRDMFSTDFDDHSVLSIIFSDKKPEIPEEWEERYYPTYMPEGFSYLRIDETPLKHELVYSNSKELLRFTILSVEMNNGNNTEKMKSTKVTVNDMPAVLYVNEEDTRSILTIEYEDCVVRIGGSIQSSEALLIGESIQVKE